MVARDLKIDEVSINNFIKNEDRKILDSLPFAERQKYINNLQQSINSHLNNSYWFARFLSKLSMQDSIMKDAFQYGNGDIEQILTSLS